MLSLLDIAGKLGQNILLFFQKFMVFIFYFLSQGLAMYIVLSYTYNRAHETELRTLSLLSAHPMIGTLLVLDITWFSKLRELLDYNCERTPCKHKPVKPSSLASSTNRRAHGIHTGWRDGPLVKSCPSEFSSRHPDWVAHNSTPAPGNLMSFLALAHMCTYT